MFENLLTKYKFKGCFTFKPNEALEAKCNAPTDQNGVYLVYKVANTREDLIYIGMSGRMKDGYLKTRQSGLGGMKDRIVNGYHPKFGKVKRKKAFPKQMIKEKIPELKIYWWVTYDKENHDCPAMVEKTLKERYLNKFGCYPAWHKCDSRRC